MFCCTVTVEMHARPLSLCRSYTRNCLNAFKRTYYSENTPLRQKEERPTATYSPKFFASIANPNCHTQLQSGAQAHIIPHPEKAGNCEDAFFVCKQGTTFGIADGVGVWSELGINSALYSSSLLTNIKSYVEENEECSLYEALLHAYKQVCIFFQQYYIPFL